MGSVGKKLTGFGNFLYNRDDKKVLGKTASGWGYILIFYCVYYSCLAGFFASMLTISLFISVPEDKPALTGKQSLLSHSPGLTVAPRQKTGHGFYHFDMTKKAEESEIIQLQQELLESYTEDKLTVVCNDTYDEFPNQPCRFEKQSLGRCANPKKAFNDGNPCIFLKLNTVMFWMPDIDNTTLAKTGLVNCSGKNLMDNELLGEPMYSPNIIADGHSYGIVSNLQFPYIKQPNYQLPLVAIQFPPLKRNVMVMVRCEVRNLKNSNGEVFFEISVDT